MSYIRITETNKKSDATLNACRKAITPHLTLKTFVQPLVSLRPETYISNESVLKCIVYYVIFLEKLLTLSISEIKTALRTLAEAFLNHVEALKGFSLFL